MIDFINRVFGKETGSKSIAKERLRLVLVHDRCNISPEILDDLKEDLIRVISKYLEIDVRSLDVSFSQEDQAMALVANIPVIGVKRQNQT
ncbi:cell division topological specificity factor MinE [Heliophilum fasciatum]|nr:cell division topological specificity factor MinE [Heliophilum fasciatum]